MLLFELPQELLKEIFLLVFPEDLLRLILTGNLGNVGKMSLDVLFNNPQFAQFHQELLNLSRKTPRILTWLDKKKLQEAMRGQSFFYQLQGMDFLNDQPIIEQVEFQNYLNRCIAQMKASNNFKKLKAILPVCSHEQKEEVYKCIEEKIKNEKNSTRKVALNALALTGYTLGRSRLLALYPFIKRDDFITPQIIADNSDVLKIYVDILDGKDFDNLFEFIKDNLFIKPWDSYFVSLILKQLVIRLAGDSIKIKALFSFLETNLRDENRVEFALDALAYLINLLDEQQLESIFPQIRGNLVSNDVNKFENAQKVLTLLKRNKIKPEKIKLLLLDIHQGLLNRKTEQKNDRDILSIIAAMQAVPIQEWFNTQLKDVDVLEKLKAWRIVGAYLPPLSQLEIEMLADVLLSPLLHLRENVRILAIEVTNLFAYALVSKIEVLLPSLKANLRKNMLVSNRLFYERLHLLIIKAFISFAVQINKKGNGFAWLETNLEANDKESLEIKLKGFYSLIKSNATNVPVDSILLVLQQKLEILKQDPKDEIKNLLPIMLALLVSLLRGDLLNSEKIKLFLPLLEDILLTSNFDQTVFKVLGILSESISGWIASKATERIIVILKEPQVGNKFNLLFALLSEPKHLFIKHCMKPADRKDLLQELVKMLGGQEFNILSSYVNEKYERLILTLIELDEKGDDKINALLEAILENNPNENIRTYALHALTRKLWLQFQLGKNSLGLNPLKINSEPEVPTLLAYKMLGFFATACKKTSKETYLIAAASSKMYSNLSVCATSNSGA